MDDQEKGHLNPERSHKRNRHKQLLTYNVPTNNVENTNGIKGEIYNSLISHGLFPKEQKGCFKGTSYDEDRLQKGIRYGPAKLGHRQS